MCVHMMSFFLYVCMYSVCMLYQGMDVPSRKVFATVHVHVPRFSRLSYFFQRILVNSFNFFTLQLCSFMGAH